MEKIVYCSENNKYYRRTYTRIHNIMGKREKHLKKILYNATKNKNTELVESTLRQLKEVRQKKYKAVIFREILAENVPKDSKITSLRHAPDIAKYQVI